MIKILLSKEIAEQIVERSMKIVFHNVNVILPNGVIFASGDKSRIGTVHEAGRKAAFEKRRVNIYPEEANLFKGVAPGINQPIIVDGVVQMVLGVTGNPNEISRYAELAFLTAELLINQSIKNEEYNLSSSLTDLEFSEIICSVDEKPLEDDKIKLLSSLLKLPKYPYIIVLERKSGHQKVMMDIISKIQKLPYKVDLIAVKPNVFLIFDNLSEEFNNYQANIISDIANSNDIHIFCEKFDRIGNRISKLDLLILLLKSGLNQLENMSYSRVTPFFTAVDLDNTDFVSDIIFKNFDNFGFINFISDVIRNSSQGSKLVETLMTYIHENQEILRTAEKLGVHRNTIQKRFDAVKNLSGLDPKRFTDLLLLYMALR